MAGDHGTSGTRPALPFHVERCARLLAALETQRGRAFGTPTLSHLPAGKRFSTSYADYAFLGSAEHPEVLIDARIGTQMLTAPPGVSLLVAIPGGSSGSLLRVPVLALSRHGLLVPKAPELDRADLDSVRVCWKGGEARLAVAPPPANSVHAGSTAWLVLDASGSKDAESWRENVDLLFHPNTSVRGHDYEAVWNLFDGSGYFNLSDKEAPDFEPRKRDWIEASRRLQRAPSVGVQVGYYEAGRIDGTMSALALWEQAWFFYQLARPKARTLAGSSNTALYDLYRRSYEHAAADPRTLWHVALIQRNGSRFTRYVNYEIARRHAGADACTVEFRAIEIPCSVPASVPEPGLSAARPATSVSPANARELERLLDVISASRPRPYVESLDFVKERFHLEELSERWSRAGLERRREVLVARRGTEAVAAAILEFTQRGLHPFGLLDCVRTFALEPDGQRAFDSLLEAARRRYAAEGRREFIYMDEHGGTTWPSGSIDLGLADVVTISVGLTGELLDDVLMAATAADRRLAREIENAGLAPSDGTRLVL